MKTSEAQDLIRGMVKEEKLTYDPKRGLVLTEKIAGIGLAFLCELSTEQVSRIGQEFDPLFPTRKRLKSLHNAGVSVDALRAMLDELEGKKPTEDTPTTDTTEGKTGEDSTPNNSEDNAQGTLSLEGVEGGKSNNGETPAELPEPGNPDTEGNTGTGVYDPPLTEHSGADDMAGFDASFPEDVTRLNGWEEVEREQLAKEAENAEDNQGELSVQGETTDPGTDRGITVEGHTTEGVGQESGTNGASDNIQQAGQGSIGRRPRGRSGITNAGGTV